MNGITYSQISECGPVRSVNQDSVLALVGKNASLFCIADGMGGYSEGEKASKAVTDAIEEWWKDNESVISDDTVGLVSDGLESVISKVNSELFEYGQNNGVCGTTVSILFICGTKYIIIAVGDSRIYKRKGRKFSQLTVDEIWSNKWIHDPRTRKLVPDPKYGQLLNAVGTEKDIVVMKTGGTVESRSIFLLCSDGLYKFCSEKYIKKSIKYRRKADLTKRTRVLKKRVLANGEKDNLSIIMVKIDDVRS